MTAVADLMSAAMPEIEAEARQKVAEMPADTLDTLVELMPGIRIGIALGAAAGLARGWHDALDLLASLDPAAES